MHPAVLAAEVCVHGLATVALDSVALVSLQEPQRWDGEGASLAAAFLRGERRLGYSRDQGVVGSQGQPWCLVCGPGTCLPAQ